MIPCLYQHAQYSVCLASGSGGYTFGYFFLYHTRAARNQVLIVEHLEEYLARYIIRIVSGQHKRITVEQLRKIHLQEVLFYDIVSQLGKILFQISYGFKVEFYNFYGAFFRNEELCEYSHTGTNLQHWQVGACVNRIGYIFCYLQIF